MSRLSTAQARVAEHLADGLNAREIAARTFLSPDTVKSHTAAVKTAYGVRSREALVPLLRDDGYGSYVPPLYDLPPRHLAIMEQVYEGATTEEIAARLGNSPATIKNTIGKITLNADVCGQGRARLVAMLYASGQCRDAKPVDEAL